MAKSTVVFACLVGVVLAGVPTHDRVVDHKLSEAEPGSPEYDHDAFVGQDEAKEFEKLSSEESKRRLGIIFDRIDKNEDKFVTQDELHDWISDMQHKYIVDNSKTEFENHDADKDGILTWKEYYDFNFGMLSDEDWEQESPEYSYKGMLKRDTNRWKAADEDGDGNCNMVEYQAFLHPEEFDRTQEIVLEETVHDMDKNGDGKLDMTEYMNDLYRPSDKDEVEPDWVATERSHFIKFRDLNDDGFLDKEEVRQWILPEDYDHAEAESRHLIHESDTDGERDDKISKEEMLDHYDVFVGSQATEWGEMIGRHDEF